MLGRYTNRASLCRGCCIFCLQTRSYFLYLPTKGCNYTSAACSVFDIRWYVDLTTRFHLNSFKIEYPKVNAAAKGDFRAMMERTLTSSIRTGASNGSAIYALGSMFNHSCAPNVNVAWPQRNHLIDFVAKENVKKGEQFTISYIDLNEARSLDVAKRRAQLEEAYGFVCECTRCVEETRNNNNNNNNNNA